MPANTYSAITVHNQIVHNTPWFQRVYSSNPPTLEEEIENVITQQVSDDDYNRVPSSNAVHDFVVDFIVNHIGSTVIDEIVIGEHDKAPSSDVVYKALEDKASLTGDNVFKGVNTFEQAIISAEVDLFDETNIDTVPNARSVREFVSEALSDESAKYVFTTPSIEWLVSHDRDTDLFHYSVRDINNLSVYAPIEIVDSNNFKIKFTEPTSGSVIVKF
jgi:hypothetical protein